MKIACTLFAAFTLLLGVVYPCATYAIGWLFFYHHAEGTLLVNESGKIVGSHWIGQNFERPEYFHPRPSAAAYNAAASNASNLGPTSQKLKNLIAERAARYRVENRLPINTPIPIDAITTSGSGLDPHISLENAKLQAPRVAAARGLDLSEVLKKIEEVAEEPFLGLFGTRRVNVLVLNLLLQSPQNDSNPRP